jgi:PPOX class probable F420-dependent enzyme
MRLDPDTARTLFTTAPVARLATASPTGVPHLVPVTFAAAADLVVLAVDHKPKSTPRLRRLDNIAANPAVALLADHYDADWTRLWWTRADGHARIAPDGPDLATAVALLAARYPQYAARPPAGPAILITVTRWSGWSYADLPPTAQRGRRTIAGRKQDEAG